MIRSYKAKIIEGEKTVKQEVEVEGDIKEDVVNEIKEMYKALEPFCKAKSIEKMR